MNATKAAVAAVVLIALAACDMTGVPRVAGTYTGPLVFRILGEEVRGTARLVVTQSGDQVTVNGTLTLAGVTSDLAAFTGTINATGNFTTTQHGVVDQTPTDATCGELRPRSSSLTFSNGTAKLVQNVNTDRCGLLQMTATLTRE